MNNHLDLLKELVKTNFKIRYNNSVLGFIWVLIRPFATFVILYFVWTAFRGNQVENYQLKLLLGIIMFTFVNEAVIFGMNGLLDKAHIILKVNFPREIAVLSSMLMAVINLLINLGIFLVFALIQGIIPSLSAILIFIAIVTFLAFFIYALDLILSVWLVKLRDLQHIFELFFQLAFWVTPIFYELDQIGGTVSKFISLNPLGWFIKIAREALINNNLLIQIPIWDTEISSMYLILITAVLAFVMFIFARIIFANQIKKIAEYF